MPSSYALGDHFEQFIRQQVESGRYASASEVVREALRTLEGRERLREIEMEEYRAKIREDRASVSRILGFEIGAHALRATAATNRWIIRQTLRKDQAWLGHGISPRLGFMITARLVRRTAQPSR